MKARGTLVALLYLLSTQVTATDFCDGAKFVPLDQLLTNHSQLLNKRVQTRAILTTDAKEYTRIRLTEKSDFTILTTADDESTTYSQRHNILDSEPFNVVSDFFKKLRALEGTKYKKDMSKIRYYRQDVIACGRLIKEQSELRFAIDDIHIERTYLLPWRH